MPVLETIAAIGAGAAVFTWLTEPGGPLARFVAPEETPPPPGQPDTLCIANDDALKKASKRQWTVCVRLARKYKSGPIAFPQNWRCLAGTTSDGMEKVFEAWAERVAARAQSFDPRAWEALLYANAQTFEAFGQKMKDKLQHEIDGLKKHFDPVSKAGKKIEDGAKNLAKKAGIKL